MQREIVAWIKLFVAVFVRAEAVDIDNEMLVLFPENTSGENLRE